MAASFHFNNSHNRHVRCVFPSTNAPPKLMQLPRRPAAIAAIRVFALWNRDWRLFAVIMIAGLFPAATNLVSDPTDHVWVEFRVLIAITVAPVLPKRDRRLHCTVEVLHLSVRPDGSGRCFV